jgi:hypothetical protein
MKPISTEDMQATIEWSRIQIEFRKGGVPAPKPLSMQELDALDRHLLSLGMIKRVLKMVRYYGGFEAIQDSLRVAIQAKQPSLFDESKPMCGSKNESLESETVPS